jgi:hypothetical protein
MKTRVKGDLAAVTWEDKWNMNILTDMLVLQQKLIVVINMEMDKQLFFQSARNVTVGKFVKCLHFISIIVWKLIIGLIIEYVSLKNIQKILQNPTLTQTWISGSYRFATLASVISTPKQSIMFFVLFFYLDLF